MVFVVAYKVEVDDDAPRSTHGGDILSLERAEMNNGTFRRLFHSCVINIALRAQIIIINIRIGRGGSVEEVNSGYLAMVRYGVWILLFEFVALISPG